MMNLCHIKRRATLLVAPVVFATLAVLNGASAEDRTPADLNDLEIAHVGVYGWQH